MGRLTKRYCCDCGASLPRRGNKPTLRCHDCQAGINLSKSRRRAGKVVIAEKC